jgi:hypothetical protein
VFSLGQPKEVLSTKGRQKAVAPREGVILTRICLALSDIVLELELVLVLDVLKAGRFPGPHQIHLSAATFKERG